MFTAIGQSEEEIRSFLDEGLKMKQFDHKNVLKLRGICFDENDLPMILLPYMAKKDLLSFIRNADNVLLIEDLLFFALGIARG